MRRKRAAPSNCRICRSSSNLKVADIGCGTGASTLVLGQDLDAQIIAVDFLSDFLDVLRSRAAQGGVADRIGTVNASMDMLPFEAGSLDAIWSEGAIYNMGFENGVRQWRRFLKRGGILAISDLTWLTASRPAELEAYWCAQYAEVGTASSKLAVLERNGYAPIGYFVRPNIAGSTLTTVRCSNVFRPFWRGMDRATAPRPWWPRRS